MSIHDGLSYYGNTLTATQERDARQLRDWQISRMTDTTRRERMRALLTAMGGRLSGATRRMRITRRVGRPSAAN